jgi:polar amino acid transport system substrate-binding protein
MALGTTARPLIVASAYPDPPFDVEDAGSLSGFDVELMRAICARIGRAMEPVRYTGSDFNGIFGGLQDGRYDAVISGTTITPERAELVLFSEPYLEFGQGVAVATNSAPQVRSSADLSGFVVGIQKGNTSDIVARKLLSERAIESIAYYAYDDIGRALDDLESGSIGAIIKLAPVLRHLISARPKLRLAFEVDTHERLGIAVAKTAEALCEQIDGALRDLAADGTIAALRARWDC